jgi:hypothetical protein
LVDETYNKYKKFLSVVISAVVEINGEHLRMQRGKLQRSPIIIGYFSEERELSHREQT